MDIFNLKGKIAVVLGGSGVLGCSMVKGLAQAGADVLVVGRDMEKAGRVVEQTKTYNTDVAAYCCDATDKAALEELCAYVLKKYGKIDILVSAVGGNMKAATTNDEISFFDLDGDAIEKVVNLNLMAGAVLPAQVFGKVMKDSKEGGVIINISSMSAFTPLTRIPGYSAAKAAVSNFTQWLAVDMAQKYGEKIRVNAIAPGFFLTEQNRFLLTDANTGELSPRGRSIINGTPMGRFGESDELIGALCWLASDASRFVTGIVVPVDGGYSAFSGV